MYSSQNRGHFRQQLVCWQKSNKNFGKKTTHCGGSKKSPAIFKACGLKWYIFYQKWGSPVLLANYLLHNLCNICNCKTGGCRMLNEPCQNDRETMPDLHRPWLKNFIRSYIWITREHTTTSKEQTQRSRQFGNSFSHSFIVKCSENQPTVQ